MNVRRVVITGLGVVAGLGIGKEVFWENLLAGRRARGAIVSFDTSGLPIRQASTVPGFDLSALLPTLKVQRDLTRGNKFVLAAAGLALRDAALAIGECEDVGIVLATLYGAHLLHPRDCETILGLPSFFVSSLPNMPAGYASVTFGLQGGSVGLTSSSEACGLSALLFGCDLIQVGSAEALLVGGYEVLSYGLLFGLCALGRLASDDQVSLPFDRQSTGSVAGEGCGVLLLESYERAQRRGAHIYAEIMGYATVQSGGKTPAAVDAACRAALQKAGMTANELGAIVANATGDPARDRAEAAGLTHALEQAGKTIPVTAPKAALGEAYAASGAFAAIIAALSSFEACLPPVAACDKLNSDWLMPGLVRHAPVRIDGPILIDAVSSQASSAVVVGSL